MSRNIHRLYVLIFSLISLQVHAATNIIVHTPDQQTFTLEFSETVRVDQAVMTALEKQSLSTLSIDWLNSSLFDVSSESAHKQRVLRALINYQNEANPSDQSHWQALRNQIRKTDFGTRVFTPLDPDITRLSTEFNPMLHGSWELILRDKPEPVHVLGAVLTSDDVAWHNRFSAKSYLKQTGLLDNRASNVTVIQPDGKVENHPIAYWNEDFKEVAPGAIIYVPMADADSLHSEQNANQLIVELLRNRIPL